MRPLVCDGEFTKARNLLAALRSAACGRRLQFKRCRFDTHFSPSTSSKAHGVGRHAHGTAPSVHSVAARPVGAHRPCFWRIGNPQPSPTQLTSANEFKLNGRQYGSRHSLVASGCSDSRDSSAGHVLTSLRPYAVRHACTSCHVSRSTHFGRFRNVIGAAFIGPSGFFRGPADDPAEAVAGEKLPGARRTFLLGSIIGNSCPTGKTASIGELAVASDQGAD